MYDDDEKTVPVRSLFFLLLALSLLSSLTVTSCGNNEEQKEIAVETAQYDNWQRYTYGHFTAYFSPASPFIASKERLVKGYNNFLDEICSLLELTPPAGKIDLYIYATPQELASITGKDASFRTDSSIHWDGRSPYGYQLAKFVLAANDIEPGKFRVAYEGVANLLDFSGINYHRETANLIGRDWFVPLDRLGIDSIFMSMPEPVRRMESASLAGFIMYNYGPEPLLVLAGSIGEWKETIESLFNTNLEAFQQKWLDFAKAQAENPGGAEGKTTP